MDRNSIIGFIMIGLLVVAYMIYNQPTEEQMKETKRKRDSVVAARDAEEKAKLDSLALKPEQKPGELTVNDSLPAHSLPVNNDSLKAVELVNKYGAFANSAYGENEYVTLENEKIKVRIASKGGRIADVGLKDYLTYEAKALYLFNEESSVFNLNFFDQRKSINSSELFFKAQSADKIVSGEDSAEISMRLYYNNGQSPSSTAQPGYIEFIYGLKGNSYDVAYRINIVGLDDLVKANSTGLGLSWHITAPVKEKNIEAERMSSTVFFKYADGEVDYISETKSEKIPLVGKVQWVSFKQQYFSAAIISEKGFDKTNAEIESLSLDTSLMYTKYLAANLTIPIENPANPTIPLSFYFGPNHYQILKSYDIDLQDQIDLGWGIFGWVNEYLIIPIFNFLEKFNMNYGIIIFILTIIIKVILLPLTYKNHISSAKMRVLKPDIDEFNEKHKNDDPMKKQQAMMSLYRKAGVNPLAGCLPMLLQLPILYAMFRFFPASIELRQEKFLWAEDLSTYDSIYNLGFTIPAYGDHISLFTLLMAISTFLYTKYNMQTTTMGGGMQATQMKIMTYMMPVMLLVFFNKYSAGLSYYYFLANVISILQQLVIMKWFIDEKKIHAQIQEHKAKPLSQTKSKFQQRLEDMAKKRGLKLPK